MILSEITPVLSNTTASSSSIPSNISDVSDLYSPHSTFSPSSSSPALSVCHPSHHSPQQNFASQQDLCGLFKTNLSDLVNDDLLLGYARDIFLDTEEEDLRFLKFDLDDDSVSQDSADLNTLNPSVQRLFCQTSMSSYSSSSSIVSSILEESIGAKLSEPIGSVHCMSHGLCHNHAEQVVLDNTSSCGSGSSTPSTPLSFVASHNNNSNSSHSTKAQITTTTTTGSNNSTLLPSFNEIYSPRYKSNDQLTNETSNFFKFEDFISESDCLSESDAENFEENSSVASFFFEPGNNRQHLGGTGSQPMSGSVQQVQGSNNNNNNNNNNLLVGLKEEPLDNFLNTGANNFGVCSDLGATNKTAQNKNSMLSKTLPFGLTQLNDIKIESGRETTTTNDFGLGNSPKPIRLHLHNLPLNVIQTNTMGEVGNYQSTNFDQMVRGQQQQGFETNQSMMDISTLGNMSTVQLFGGDSTNSTGSSMLTETTSTSMGSGASSYRYNKNKSIRHKTTQTCAVCGDVAACQHYGVMTCEGCKGFFKRTVQKGSKYTCLGTKDCTVDKRRRNRCQFCRFQKCLSVGMVKEVVRTDNLKGRRGRLPSKPKIVQGTSPVTSIASQLVRAHQEAYGNKSLDFTFKNNIADGSPLTLNESAYLETQMLQMLNASIDVGLEFVKKIPGFNELCEQNQRVLFQRSCLELFAVRTAYELERGSDLIKLPTNAVVHQSQFALVFGDWLNMIIELSNQLKSLEIDETGIACMCALVVMSDRPGAVDQSQIESFQMRIATSLRDHSLLNVGDHKKQHYFSRILTKLSEIRTVGAFGHEKVMNMLRHMKNKAASYGQYNLRLLCTLEMKLSDEEVVDGESTMITSGSEYTLNLPSISSVYPSVFPSWPSMK